MLGVGIILIAVSLIFYGYVFVYFEDVVRHTPLINLLLGLAILFSAPGLVLVISGAIKDRAKRSAVLLGVGIGVLALSLIMLALAINYTVVSIEDGTFNEGGNVWAEVMNFGPTLFVAAVGLVLVIYNAKMYKKFRPVREKYEKPQKPVEAKKTAAEKKLEKHKQEIELELRLKEIRIEEERKSKQRLALRCPHCKAQVDEDAKFCNGCGAQQ